MSGLQIEQLYKTWPKSGETVLDGIDLTVEQGEFCVLLGPSGCGKSTLLRSVAGLVSPDRGRILLDGRDITDLEPQDRGVGIVFQNYALFPHMSIRKNLSFPLDVAHTASEEKKKIIREVLEKLEIPDTEKRQPHMLSGGERQRAAVGRAMVRESRIYLFDEPLSNLDESLRSRLRPEIRELFRTIGVPFLYVTHDQVDAMTLATKVALMDGGRIVQTGTPLEVYDEPNCLFAARFLGTPRMNLLKADVAAGENGPGLRAGPLFVDLPKYRRALAAYGKPGILIGIRPEHVDCGQSRETASVCADAILERYEQPGSRLHLFVSLAGQEICLTAPLHVRARVGEALKIRLDTERMYLFDPDTGKRLYAM